ncbi:MAG: amino acid adenylation domain-containing protein [Phycisphaeraceae bacterium]
MLETANRSGDASEATTASLSPMQHAMTFCSLLAPAAGYYIEQLIVDLPEPVDGAALAKAWQTVGNHHAILRSGFDRVGGTELMRVQQPRVRVPFHVLNWSNTKDEEQRLADWRAEDRRRGFELNRPPLMRLTLIQLAPCRNKLIWTFHHALLDGRSFSSVLIDVFAVYTSIKSGRLSDLATPRPFTDYIDWLATQEWSRSQPFWRRYLKGLASPTPFVVDHAQRPVADGELDYGLHRNTIDPDITSQLLALARTSGVTMNTIVQTAWATLLSRYSGSNDVVFGATRACRKSSVDGADQMVGIFINTLPLRVALDPQATIQQSLADVRSAWNELRHHEHTPLAEIQVCSAIPSGTPLFESVLVFENYDLNHFMRRQGADWAGRSIELHERTNFPITVAAYLHEGLHIKIEFDRRRFDDKVVERMLGHLRTLLEGLAKQPDGKLGDLPLLTDSECRELGIHSDVTLPAFDSDTTLHTWFERQAAQSPAAVAVSFETEQLTYDQLNRRSNQLASILRSKGIGPGTKAGLFLDRSLDTVVAILAVLKAGGAYVPCDPVYPADRIAYMLSDAAVPVVLTERKLADRLPALSAVTLVLDDLRSTLDTEDDGNLDAPSSPDDIAYVIYTSGSTGRPKGVQVTHRNVARLFTATDDWFAFGPHDVWTMFHSYAFDFSVWEMWGALLYGGRLVVVPFLSSRSPQAFHNLLLVEGVTVLNQTPSAFYQLMSADEGIAQDESLNLRLVIFGGEALDLSALRPWFDRHGDEQPQLVNMYGITETTVHVTYRPLTRADALSPLGSLIGVPIPDLKIYLLDPSGQPVPIGVPGEMYVGGAGVAAGYLNQPVLTDARFLPDRFQSGMNAKVYRSGDLARRLESGELDYLGRIDHQVQLRGFRVELGEIESVLGQHDAVRNAVVLCREDQQGDKRLVAYIVASTQWPTLVDELRKAVAARLPSYMAPSAYVFLDKLPLTPHGKTDRKALPAPTYISKAETDSIPDSTLAKNLAAIWAEVLHVDRVGINDDFFELGGHSLIAATLITRVQDRLGLRIPLRLFFESPTIAALLRSVDLTSMSDAAKKPNPAPAEHADSHGLPASSAQSRLWFLDQLEEERAVYNIPISIWIEGAVHLDALQSAINAIVRRHEIIRTNLIERDGVPIQIVRDVGRVTIEQVDLSRVDATQLEQETQRAIDDESRQPFNLAEDAMLRAKLIHRGHDEHVLVLTMHHIASDGWSINLLMSELASLYRARVEGTDEALPDLPIQYADATRWQQANLTKEKLQPHVDYWRRQLAGVPPLLELPGDRPRPVIKSYKGHMIRLNVSKLITDEARRLSRSNHVTLFMTLLAAFKTLIHRYTGESDIVVSTPTAGRDTLEWESLIGFFVNTTPLRTDVSGNPTFRELLHRVRDSAVEGYGHQRLTFDKLVEELKPARSRSHEPFSQFMLVLNHDVHELGLAGTRCRTEYAHTGTAKFDLTLSFIEKEEGLQGYVEYASDLFDRDTVERMCGHFLTLLDSIVAGPDRPVSELPMLTESEGRRVIDEWNDTARPFDLDTPLHVWFERQVDNAPDAVAVVLEDQQWTYIQLNERANQLARHLRALHFDRGQLAAICMERSIEMVISLLAVLKAGGAYVPIDPAYPSTRVGFMIEDSNTSIVLTQSKWIEAIPAPHRAGTGVVQVDAEREKIARNSATNLDIPTSGDDLAYVIYTSGSTGMPNGAMIPHRAICNHMHWMCEAFDLNSSDSVLQHSPFVSDSSVWEFFAPLMVGGKLVLAGPEMQQAGSQIIEAVRRCGITTLQVVPAQLRLMLADPQLAGCASLRRICSCGEVLPARVCNDLLSKLRVNVYNLYGATETCISTTWHPCEHVQESDSVPIGRPIANMRAYVLNAERRPVPIGVPGELYVGGAGVGVGYLNRPDLTTARYIPDPFAGNQSRKLYRTGDLCRFRTDGSLEFLGRTDRQVKVRGCRIEPGEVEAAMVTHPAVKECVVTRKGHGGEEYLVAYVVSPAGSDVPASQFHEHLARQLPAGMVPSVFLSIPQLPLLPSGKVDYRALPDPKGDRDVYKDESLAPRNVVEEKLVAIWKQLLRVDRIGVDDNFFELGGHSLIAVRMANEIEDCFGQSVPLAALFETPTIAALARLLHNEADTSDLRNSLVTLRPGGSRVPVFFVHGIGGEVMCFRELVKALGDDQPVYGLQARGIHRDDLPHRTIKEMATHYVERIRDVLPDGPFMLAGYSSGGTIAFEMAQQLTASGVRVPWLAILDTQTSDLDSAVPRSTLKRYYDTLLNLPRWLGHDLKRSSPRQLLRKVLSLAKRRTVRQVTGSVNGESDVHFRGTIDDEPPYGSPNRMQQPSDAEPVIDVERAFGIAADKMEPARLRLINTHFRALLAYAPRTYSGSIVLFRAKVRPLFGRRDAKLGWDRVAAGGVKVKVIPGNHDTLLRNPNVLDLADAMRQSLDDALRTP